MLFGFESVDTDPILRQLAGTAKSAICTQRALAVDGETVVSSVTRRGKHDLTRLFQERGSVGSSAQEARLLPEGERDGKPHSHHR
jgi:hypothetical protein